MKINLGDSFLVKLPASEICLSMRIVGKLARVKLVGPNLAVVSFDNEEIVVLMYLSEAGIRFDNGEYYADVIKENFRNEYNDRWNAPLVNPSFTMAEYERRKYNF